MISLPGYGRSGAVARAEVLGKFNVHNRLCGTPRHELCDAALYSGRRVMVRYAATWIVVLTTAFGAPTLLCGWTCIRSESASHGAACHDDANRATANLVSSHSCDHGSDALAAETVTAVALSSQLQLLAGTPPAPESFLQTQRATSPSLLEFPPGGRPHVLAAPIRSLRL